MQQEVTQATVDRIKFEAAEMAKAIDDMEVPSIAITPIGTISEEEWQTILQAFFSTLDVLDKKLNFAISMTPIDLNTNNDDIYDEIVWSVHNKENEELDLKAAKELEFNSQENFNDARFDQ